MKSMRNKIFFVALVAICCGIIGACFIWYYVQIKLPDHKIILNGIPEGVEVHSCMTRECKRLDSKSEGYYLCGNQCTFFPHETKRLNSFSVLKEFAAGEKIFLVPLPHSKKILFVAKDKTGLAASYISSDNLYCEVVSGYKICWRYFIENGELVAQPTKNQLCLIVGVIFVVFFAGLMAISFPVVKFRGA